jgi:hypothetical protein
LFGAVFVVERVDAGYYCARAAGYVNADPVCVVGFKLRHCYRGVWDAGRILGAHIVGEAVTLANAHR